MKNKICHKNDNTTVFLIDSKTHGQWSVFVDTEDIPKIENYKWNLSYDAKNKKFLRVKAKINRKTISLHFLLTGYKITDHIDMDIFNNRKSNLRECTIAENLRNRGKNKKNTSGYKGVYYDKKRNRWEAYIGFNNKQIFLGYYCILADAIMAYNNSAIKYHGEFANLNKGI